MKKHVTTKYVALLVIAALIFSGCEALDTPLAVGRRQENDPRVTEEELAAHELDASAVGATDDDLLTPSEFTGITTGEDGEAAAGVPFFTETEVVYRKKDIAAEYVKDQTVKISLKKDSITVNGPGATPDGSTVTITKAGVYFVTGTLKDGRIIVDAPSEDDVRLIFSDVDISCSTASPVSCLKADKLIITLDAGTVNRLTYDQKKVMTDDSTCEALRSDTKLSINGTGSLLIEAGTGHGINCRSELKLISGIITINAMKCGIRARDGLAVRSGTITVTSGTDAIRTGSTADGTAGYTVIEGGVLTLVSGGDGIQALGNAELRSGTVTIVAGGGRSAAGTGIALLDGILGSGRSEEDPSTKGIKTEGYLYIKGGMTDIDSADDSLHSAKDIAVSGGSISLSSGDDSIHADGEIFIRGGGIRLYSEGDGLDSVGGLTMTGGVVLAEGPSSGKNGAIDHGGPALISGGTIAALGSEENIDFFDGASEQNVVVIRFGRKLSKGSRVSVVSSDTAAAPGEGEIIGFTTGRDCTCIMISARLVRSGAGFRIIVNDRGAADFTVKDRITYVDVK